MGDDNATIKAMRAELKSLQRENRRMVRQRLHENLEVIGIDPTSPVGLHVIDHYWAKDHNGNLDLSLLSMKVWIANEMGTVLGEGV
jgi:hypothetical protein